MEFNAPAGVIKHENRVSFKRVKYFYSTSFKPHTKDYQELLKLKEQYSVYDQEYYVICEAIMNVVPGDTKLGEYTLADITELFGGKFTVSQTLRILGIKNDKANSNLLKDYGFNSRMLRMAKTNKQKKKCVEFYVSIAPIVIDTSTIIHYLCVILNWSRSQCIFHTRHFNLQQLLYERTIPMMWEDHSHIKYMNKSARIRAACQAAINKVGIEDRSIRAVNKLVGLVEEVPPCIERSFKRIQKNSYKYESFDKI